jgi:hypothetical protein
VLLGACRGLLYVLAAAAVAEGALERRALLWLGGGLGAYVALFSLVARHESRSHARAGPGGRPGWLAAALPLVALAPAAALRPLRWEWAALFAGALLAWLARSAHRVLRRDPDPRGAVMGWLSGMCLLDGLYLCLLDRPQLAALSGGLFVLTVAGHRRILGT